MSKKRKHKLAGLADKKRQLQQFESGNINAVEPQKVNQPLTAQISQPIINNVIPTNDEGEVEVDVSAVHKRDIRRTFINTLIIIILLGAAFYLDNKTNYLSTLGNNIYTILKLGS